MPYTYLHQSILLVLTKIPLFISFLSRQTSIFTFKFSKFGKILLSVTPFTGDKKCITLILRYFMILEPRASKREQNQVQLTICCVFLSHSLLSYQSYAIWSLFYFIIGISFAPTPSASCGDFQLLEMEEEHTHMKIGILACMGRTQCESWERVWRQCSSRSWTGSVCSRVIQASDKVMHF